MRSNCSFHKQFCACGLHTSLHVTHTFPPCCANVRLRTRLCVAASGNSHASAQTARKLRQLSARPKRALGQNFCLSDAVLEAIVKTAGVEPGDYVLEIGPGTGNLTRHILSRQPRLLVAVEKDDALAAALARDFGEDARLHLVHADVLDADLVELTSCAGPVKVVANVPFNITTGWTLPQPLVLGLNCQGYEEIPRHLQRLLTCHHVAAELLKLLLPLPNVASVNLMLQAEAALRLTSTAAGESAYRAISLFVAYYSTPRYCFTIDRRHFLPPPGVDAALAQFMIKPATERLGVRSERALLSFLTLCFHMRRKTLLNNLKSNFDAERVGEVLTNMGLPLSVRAQALDLGQLVSLHNQLADA